LSKPAALQMNQPSALKEAAGADLVIITRREFFAAMAALAKAREQAELRVALVDVEDIYDEFNYGHIAPQAIRDFLSYARSNWRIKPQYLLLAGDASYDGRNYLGYGNADMVPTKLIDTTYMETASDEWFTDFNNDGIADIATGRLPVRDAAEAAIV